MDTFLGKSTWTILVKCTQILSECSVPDGTEDYYSSQNEENEDKNRYSQILPSKLKSTPQINSTCTRRPTNVMQRCSQTCIFLALRFHFSFSDEMHRVKLRFSPSGSNYINASYIHVRKLNSTAHTLSALFMCYFLSRATNVFSIVKCFSQQ